MDIGDLADIEQVVAFMREHGIRRLSADGLDIELEGGRLVPMRVPPRHVTEDAKLEKEADTEKTREQREREAHERKWRRITRSSGAPIPPYKPGAA